MKTLFLLTILLTAFPLYAVRPRRSAGHYAGGRGSAHTGGHYYAGRNGTHYRTRR